MLQVDREAAHLSLVCTINKWLGGGKIYIILATGTGYQWNIKALHCKAFKKNKKKKKKM